MSQLTSKKLGWRYWPRSAVFIVVSFEHILHTSGVSIVGFEEVNARWGGLFLMFVTRVKWLSYRSLIIKLKFWEYWTRFDSKQFFLDIIIVFEVTHLWHPQKMANKWPSHFHHPQKLAIDLSANTWQILRTPLFTPLLSRHRKCMFPFWLFKVWSVTCLNANEILNFIKIQSSYLLSSYQRNQASLYFQLYQLLFEQLFGKFMSVTIIYVCYSWQDFVFEM